MNNMFIELKKNDNTFNNNKINLFFSENVDTN
jgi:hypothetical protein